LFCSFTTEYDAGITQHATLPIPKPKTNLKISEISVISD
jgi:hypothetical protein